MGPMLAPPLTDPLTSISSPQLPPVAQLQVLDDPMEWGAFSHAAQGDSSTWVSHVVVHGMHCAACSVSVEDALLRVPGVVGARVSAATQRATVQWRVGQTVPSQWMQSVQSSGYQLVPANDVFASQRRKAESRAALWRWLVAGLCMMQVMMYAYPAYIARAGDLSAEMERLLRWASWVLTLPVVLFSCGPFFRSAWKDVVHRRIGMDLPVALGIAVTFVVSTAGTFEPAGIFGREVYFDSLTMFVFFLLSGRWLELRLRDRTAGALESVMNRLPDSVERQHTDGTFERVAVRRIVVGDLLRMQPGEPFAADGEVEFGAGHVDEAILSGESRPLWRQVGDTVLAGSQNLSATMGVRVQRVATDTRFAQIVALMESASASKPHIALVADRLAKPFLVAVLVCALGAALWWWERDPQRALMVAVAVLVVTCPCALSLATPAAMLASAGRLARSGVLVRKLQALEALSKVDTVVFDKTGTLSGDALFVQRIECRDGVSPAQALQWAQALAQHSRHPASRAVCQGTPTALALPGAPLARSEVWVCDGVTEWPGQGLSGTVQGVHQTMDLRLGSAAFCGLAPWTGDETALTLSDGQGWVATVVLQEELRPDAQACVQALVAMGIEVHMLSGDAPGAVRRVAKALCIDRARGGCSPDDKLDSLRALQAHGQRVAMVGDGLNDGPVLAVAHVSFAFGRAVPLAQARADFVVLGEQLMAVAATVGLARQTMAVVRQNLAWALMYNAACVPLAVAGLLPAWLAGLGMASSSLLVVSNALRLTRAKFSLAAKA